MGIQEDAGGLAARYFWSLYEACRIGVDFPVKRPFIISILLDGQDYTVLRAFKSHPKAHAWGAV